MPSPKALGVSALPPPRPPPPPGVPGHPPPTCGHWAAPQSRDWNLQSGFWSPVLAQCPPAGRARSRVRGLRGPGHVRALQPPLVHQGWPGAEGPPGGSVYLDHEGAIVLQAWPQLESRWEGTKAVSQCRSSLCPGSLTPANGTRFAVPLCAEEC